MVSVGELRFTQMTLGIAELKISMWPVVCGVITSSLPLVVTLILIY